MKYITVGFLLALFLITSQVKAQTPGIIVRPAGTSGPLVLDPNADGYTSKTTAGFGANDDSTSEIPYKIVPPVTPDPTGDLFRGPSGSFSDIVKGVDGSGFYLFNDGTNFLCRLRIGGIVSGSKGYSVLIDTDGKFGNVGADADPNYVAGNPGFELEIIFETNSQVAIYNVDGTSTPVLMSFYSIPTNSQISVAGSTNGANPDFFYDFYVPFSALGISASTPLRAAATTVMSPSTAIGGPVSDIYGVSQGDYMTQWTNAIEGQPPFTFTNLGSGGPGIGAIRTAPPIVNAPIYPSSTTISGTWTKSIYSAFSTATITLYNGTNILGTATVTSGGSWTITVSGLVNNDVITAVAMAIGESKSITSNKVIVNTCNASNSPATPTLLCSTGTKGITGTNLTTGWTINVDDQSTLSKNNSIINVNQLFSTSYTGTSPNLSWDYSSGCSGGSPLPAGSYKVYYTNASGCNSQPAFFCTQGNGNNALAGSLNVPVITNPANGVYNTATTTISGTIASGTTPVAAFLTLYIDGQIAQTTTATSNGVFSFTNLLLAAGQQLYIIAEKSTGSQLSSYCESTTAVFTVTCFTTAPGINVSNNNQLMDALPITGSSAEPAATVIRIYTAANVLVSTTNVQSDGSWSTANAGSTPAAYTAIAGTSYYANAQNGTCTVSSNSTTYSTTGNTAATRCGTIQAVVSETALTVSGTVNGIVANTLVNLYEDGSLIGSATTSSAFWGPININTNNNNILYAGGVLTIGIADPLKNEVACSAQTVVSCTPPNTPSFTPVVTTVSAGNTVTYTLIAPQAGILYSLMDNTNTYNMGSSGFVNGTNILSLVSFPFNTTGTFTLQVKALSLSGNGCLSISPATVNVVAPLPVTLLDFEGTYNQGLAKLTWSTSSEQNMDNFQLQKSYSGDVYLNVATIKAAGNSQVMVNYAYTDTSETLPVVYYRLKMNDIGPGKSSYSKIIALHADNRIVLNSVSPNPFLNSVKIKLNTPKEVALVISLSDISGRKIKTLNYTTQKGDNTILLSELQNVLKGTYFMELMLGSQNIYRQLLIKQ